MEKIPFIYEVKPICNNIHLKSGHAGLNCSQDMLLKIEFYWEEYSSSLKNVIDNCLICAKTKNINISERPEMKHIIPNGPHHRYQCDSWELNKDIVS